MAADLTAAGHRVHLYELPEFGSTLAEIRRQGGIDLQGASGSDVVMPAVLTDDPGEALAGVELVHVAVPAFAHHRVVEAILPHLRDGQFVLFNTDYWAALRFRGRLAAGSRITLAESTLLAYAARKVGPAAVRIDGVKEDFPMAALPASRTESLVALVRQAYPQARPLRSVLEVSLENLNPLFHPAISLLNAGELERTAGDFGFYSAGCTPAVGRVIDAVDRERMDVARALGLPDLNSVADWLRRYYGAQGSGAYDAIQSCPAYRTFRWPASTAIRYVHEDVPYAFVPLASMATQFGIPTPTTRALVELCGLAFGRDYWSEGPGVDALGIAGLRPADVARLATDG